MSRAVRGSLVGLALALLFWFSLAPSIDRDTLATLPVPEPATEEEEAGLSPALESEARRSEALLPPAPVPVEPPASAPASAPSGRYAFEVLVIDDEARPVGGATVTAFTERTTDGRTKRVAVDPPNEWTTDAAGRCPLHVPMPRFGIYVGLHLAAEKAGVGRSGSQWVSPETPPRIRLVLFSPVRVEGRVMGADGLPARDATVHFSRENGPEGGEEGLPLAQPVDSQGRYSTEVLAGGQFEVWAEGGGQGTERARVHSFPGSRHEVDFWLPGALTIEGVLRDPSGNPVSGGKTWAWRDHGPATRWGPSQWRPDAFFGTDSDKGGRYRISVSSPGTYMLAGIAPGFASSLPVEVSVGENTPHAKVDLKLFEGATISGVVRKADGEPIAGINLQAAMEARSDFFARIRGRTASAGVLGGGECRTREDGSFEWRSLHPVGTYTIRRYPDSFPSTGWDSWPILREVRAGTRDLEIVLPGDRPRTCPVTGTVLGPGDAGPPREFTVSLDHDFGDDTWSAVEHHSSRGRTDGRFSLDRAISGERYMLRAGGGFPGAGSARVGPWIARPEGNEFTIRLRPHGSLECRVVDGAGRPVPFADVDGEPFPPHSIAQGFQPDRTDETGTVRFKGVEPTGYRIRVWKGTHSSEPVEVEILEGDRNAVTIVIPR